MLKTLYGYAWLIREYGPRAALRYALARRRGVLVDYSEAFSPEELAVIGEHFSPAPWEEP